MYLISINVGSTIQCVMLCNPVTKREFATKTDNAYVFKDGLAQIVDRKPKF